MTQATDDPIVTPAHTAAFGSVMFQYAAAESGIKIALAGVLKIDLLHFLILSEPYSSFNLRTVAKTLIKEIMQPGPDRERFIHLVGTLGAFGPLRNHIGHSRWTHGERPGAIKPFGIDIRSGSAKLLGKLSGETDWTTDDLLKEAEALRKLNGNIVQFLTDMSISGIIT